MDNPEQYFNPRAREGRDVVGYDFLAAEIRISIHAPVKGATGKRQAAHFRCKHHFNPRAREGRDSNWTSRSVAVHDFNPRAREGRDTKGAKKMTANNTFQSTRP